jgi:hypothetical protein
MTGDNHWDAIKVAKELGVNSSKILLGNQIDTLKDRELEAAALKCNIFAKLSPDHKQRIIHCLQDAGNTVGYLGDGINDVLMVRGKGIASVKNFRIFNRWGELVFERSNFSPNIVSFGWDGRIRGVVGPPDVFVYTAEVICENGTSYVYKGNTSIIK